jgi:membrane protease YdiL (CAAX protease family)
MNQPNSRAAIAERQEVLAWFSLVIVLFARPVLAVAAQGLVALIYASQGSATPWKNAGPWLPVYGTLIDAGCLAFLWWLTRREGISLFDLIGYDRRLAGRDILLGIALVPACLVFIFGGVAISSLLIYGTIGGPQINAPLPLLPALYSVLIWPLIWGFTEQMTYNGYLLPRFQVMSGSTVLAIAIVTFVWSFQHMLMPLTFDAEFMTHRLLSSLPNSVFSTLVYLRLRRLLPLAIAHWLMDGASAFIGSLWPLIG